MCVQHCCVALQAGHTGCLFTWSLPLIIINKFDEVILLYPAKRARKQENKMERGRQSERKRVPLTCRVRSLHVCDIF